jgi:predicted nucleic acid-binding protein
MIAKVMLDTNLWVYLYAQNAPEKQAKVQTIVSEKFEAIVVSTQILGELYHVLTRKRLADTAVAKEIILEMVTTFPIVEFGDNLDILRGHVADESVDLSYPDLSRGSTSFKKAKAEVGEAEQGKLL